MNYEELVKALRCVELRLSCNECEYGTWSESGEAWVCEFERRDADAAAAIEALQAQLPKRGEWENWNPKKIWVPSKKGLGMGKVFDMANEIYGKDFYRYE